ncbi:hypothetical protein [Mycobacteroides abscessus]|uniref:hypothetical protein n=1 Tax=Mycobacteroides abscessus TaxID=36809 RepID=UPI00187781CB
MASGDKPRTARSGSTALTTAAGTSVGPTFPVGAAADPVDEDPPLVAGAVDDELTGATDAVAPAAAGAPIPGDGNNGNWLADPPAPPAAEGVTTPCAPAAATDPPPPLDAPVTGAAEAGPATGGADPTPAAGGGDETGGGTTELADENPRAKADPGFIAEPEFDDAEAAGFVDESPPKPPAGDWPNPLPSDDNGLEPNPEPKPPPEEPPPEGTPPPLNGEGAAVRAGA